MRHGLLLVLAVGTLCWTSPALAIDKLQSGPAPTWVIPASASKPGHEATSADLEFLLEDRQLHLSPSGDELYVDSIVRIGSPRGLSALGTIALVWNPDTTTVTVHALHIHRGEQTVDVLASQTFTVLRREQNLEYAVLDGTLTAAVQPVGLQVGDMVELAYTLKRSDPVLAGVSEWLIGGLPNMPIAHMRVRASWSTSSHILWKASESMTGLKEQHLGDQTVVSGEFDNQQPLLQPKGAPARFAQLREVVFSGDKSWGEISTRLAPLYEQAAQLSDSSLLRAEIERIRNTYPEPVAQAEAALKLVQEQVRYVFLGMNDGGLVPASADVTWTRRFGDCKGKTVLLLALLHGLGIEARPAAVSSTRGDGLDEKLPMVGWFDHVLTQATIAGKPYWLDGTRPGDRRLENVPDFAFKWALPLTTKGGSLVAIPVRPLEHPNNTLALRIDASAGLYAPAPIHAEMILQGDAGLAIKYALANATADEIDRRLREYWKKQYDFVEVSAVSQAFDELTATARWTMDGVAQMDWESGAYETDGFVLGYKADLKRTAGPRQDAPYQVAFPSYSQVTETVLLPYGGAGFSIEGVDIDRTVGGMEYRRHATLEKGVFTAEKTTRAIAPEFAEVEAPGVQQALREMAKLALRIRSPSTYKRTARDREAQHAPPPVTAGDFLSRGNKYMDDDDYDRAIDDFNHALALDPRNDMALAGRGMSEVWQKKSGLAIQDLNSAYDINPKNAVVFRGRGLLALESEHYRDAVAALSRSLELDSQSALAYGKRAEAYFHLGDNQQALDDIEQALHLSPTWSVMFSLRAQVLQVQGKPDQAMLELAKAAAAASDDAEMLLWIGSIYESMHSYEAAMRMFDRAVELSPSEQSYLLRSQARRRNDLIGSRADVEAALKINPHSREAQTDLARVQFLAHQYKEEIATLNALMMSSNDAQEMLIQRAIAYSKSGQDALATADLSRAQASASTGRDFNELCWDLATADVELDMALKSCDTALERSFGQPQYVDSRGFVLLRMGRFDEAIGEYDRALEMLPTQAHSRYGRGIAKRRKGDQSGGNVDIEAATKANPNIETEFSEYGIQP